MVSKHSGCPEFRDHVRATSDELRLRNLPFRISESRSLRISDLGSRNLGSRNAAISSLYGLYFSLKHPFGTGEVSKVSKYGIVSKHNGCLEFRAHERRATSYDYGISDLGSRNLGVSESRISECRNLVSLPDMLGTKTLKMLL